MQFKPNSAALKALPAKEGLTAIRRPFDAEHSRLFTFALPLEHEFVSLRAVVQGKGIRIKHTLIGKGGADAKGAFGARGTEPRRTRRFRSAQPATIVGCAR